MYIPLVIDTIKPWRDKIYRGLGSTDLTEISAKAR